MPECKYTPDIHTTDRLYIDNTPLASILVGMSMGVPMFGMVEFSHSNNTGWDSSISGKPIEHGTYAESESAYVTALIELDKAQKKLATEYRLLLESQIDVDPEIDAIINENLSDLYMTS